MLLHISWIIGLMVSLITASCSFFFPPGFSASMIRLITSAPKRICPFPEELLARISPVSILIRTAETVVVPISTASPPMITSSLPSKISYTNMSSGVVRITHFTENLLLRSTSGSFLSTEYGILIRFRFIYLRSARVSLSLSGMVSSRDGSSMCTSTTSRLFVSSMPAASTSCLAFSKIAISSFELRSATFIRLLYADAISGTRTSTSAVILLMQARRQPALYSSSEI